MLIVQKFGGSSVADAAKIRRVAGIIADAFSEDHKLVVVLSAQGDTTDELIAKANELNPAPSRREMDALYRRAQKALGRSVEDGEDDETSEKDFEKERKLLRSKSE